MRVVKGEHATTAMNSTIIRKWHQNLVSDGCIEGHGCVEYTLSSKLSNRTRTVLSPAAMRRVKLHDAVKTHGARCLDGSPAVYYARRATALANRSRFVVYFQAGGWCFASSWSRTVKACTARMLGRMGSTTGYPESLDDPDSVLSGIFDNDGQIGGILSPIPEVNPDFASWTAVWIAYCDGGSFSGNRSEPIDIGQNRSLWFRGRSIVHAVVEDLAAKYGMGNATDVLLAGSSSGGLAAMMHADYVRSQLPPDVRFGVLSDSGWFRPSYSLDRTRYTERMRTLYWTMQSVSDAGCEAAMGEADRWKCIFAPNVFPHVGSRVFVLEAAYDAWQLLNILGIDCSTYGQSLCACTVEDMHAINAYGSAARLSILEALNSTAHHATSSGALVSACILHGQAVNVLGTRSWDLRAGGTSPRDSVRAWFFAAGGRASGPMSEEEGASRTGGVANEFLANRTGHDDSSSERVRDEFSSGAFTADDAWTELAPRHYGLRATHHHREVLLIPMQPTLPAGMCLLNHTVSSPMHPTTHHHPLTAISMSQACRIL